MAPKKSAAVNDLTTRMNGVHIGVIDHFNNTYGRSEKLEALQELCRDVGVQEGTSVTQCKKVAILTHLLSRSVSWLLKFYRTSKVFSSTLSISSLRRMLALLFGRSHRQVL